MRCQLDHPEWRTDYRLAPFVTQQGASVSTRASFVVESGRPGVQVDTQ
ncbi:hypothetical protein [Micromonospora sp. URMC 103]